MCVVQLMIITPCSRICRCILTYRHTVLCVFHMWKQWVRFTYVCYIGIPFKMLCVILVIVMPERKVSCIIWWHRRKKAFIK